MSQRINKKYIYYFRRITTVNKWFEDNGYNVKEIWDSIEVSKALVKWECVPFNYFGTLLKQFGTVVQAGQIFETIYKLLMWCYFL